MTEAKYRTPAKAGEALLKVSGSKFYGFAYPVTSRHDCDERLAALRKKYFDATHCCSAFRLLVASGETEQLSLVGIGSTQITEKFSDDGEPSGTAGRPILNAIKASEHLNVLVVVVRYFGGTLLGVGGLVKAYNESAKLALADGGTREVFLTDAVKVQFPFDQKGIVMHAIHRHDVIVTQVLYTEIGEELTLAVRKPVTGRFMQELVQATNGKARPEILRESL
jgi:uncharacterized YigZ family protein